MSEPEDKLTTGAQPKRRAGRPRKSSVHSADQREHADRETGERELDEREMTDEDRLDAFRSTMFENALPNLPTIPGYHVCWLTTTNPRDTVQSRIRMGYQLIRLEEMPGWESVSLKTGEYAGVLGINEMLASKIPLRLYNAYMKESHHNRPLEEEQRLKAKVELMKQQASEVGGEIIEGDGTANLVQRARPMPEFVE